MNKHLIFLLFILLFTLGQNQPEIKMLSGQVSQCSSGNSMGRIDYKIKYSFSSATDLTSYFMLFLSDGSSEKRPSICQLYYNSTEESTDDDSKNGTESDDEEGKSTESDNEEGKNTESDDKEGNKTDNTEVNVLFEELKSKLDFRIKSISKEVENLQEIGLDVRMVLSYSVVQRLHLMYGQMTQMETTIDSFTEEKVIEPISQMLIKLEKETKDLNVAKVKKMINETVCNVKLDVFNAVKSPNFVIKDKIEDQKVALQEKIEEIKEKLDEGMDSPILKDIFAKLDENADDLVPEKIKNSELGEKMADFASKIKDLYGKGNSSILNDLENLNIDFKEKAYQSFIFLLDKTLTGFNKVIVGELLFIQKTIKRIKELGKDDEDPLEKYENEIKESIEKIKAKIQDFIKNNEPLKPILKQFDKIKSNIKEKLEKIDSYIKKKVEEQIDQLKEQGHKIEDKYKKMIKDQINEIMKMTPQNVVDMFPKISGFNAQIYEEIKDIINIEDLIRELKKNFEGFSLENNNEKIKELIGELKDKSEKFVSKTIVLKSFTEKLNEEYKEYKDQFDKYGLLDAIKKHYSSLDKLVKDLNIFTPESLQKVEDTFYTLVDTINALDLDQSLLKHLPETSYTKQVIQKMNDLDFNSDIEQIKGFLAEKNLREIIDKREELLPLVLSLKEKLLSFQVFRLKLTGNKIKEDIGTKLGITDELNSYIESIKKLDQIIGEGGKQMNEKIYEQLQKSGLNIDIEQLKNGLVDFPEFKPADLEKLFDVRTVVGKLQEIYNKYKDVPFGEIYKQEKPKINKLLNELTETINQIKTAGLLDTIKSDIQTARNNLNKEGGNELRLLFKNYFDNLKTLLTSLKEVSLNINNELQKSFYGIYEDIEKVEVNAKLKELIDKIPSLSEIQTSIGDIQDSVKNYNYTEQIFGLLNKLKSKLAEIDPSIGNYSLPEGADIINIFGKIKNLPSLIGSFMETLNELKETLAQAGISDIPDMSAVEELNSTIYAIKPLIDKLDGLIKELPKAFQGSLDFNNIISHLKTKFEGLNSTEIISKYGTELKGDLEKLGASIQKFTNDHEEIKYMKDKANEIKAIFEGADTSKLEDDFNKYIESLRDLYNSLKNFCAPLDKKLRELFYPIVEQIQKAGGQPILDALANLKNLPKNMKDQIGQMQDSESIMKTITDLFDDIDSLIDVEKLTKLFNNLKTTLESISKGELVNQLEEFQSNEFVNALKEHFSALKALLGPLKKLALADNDKVETAVNEVLKKIKSLMKGDIEANIKTMYQNGVDKMENIFDIEAQISKIQETFENKDIKEVLKEQKGEVLKKFAELKKKIEAEDGGFIKVVKNQVELCRSILDEAGVIAAFNNHIDALKNLALDMEDKQNFENYKASIEGIKKALANVNSQEVIIALNSTLFEFKDTFIEQINTLPKLQKIIENLQELIQSENLYEKLKTELDKLKEDEKLAPIFEKLEEIKLKVEAELKKAGISQTVDEYVEQLKQLKEKLAVQNIKEIILNELSTCDNKFIEQMDKVGEIEGVVNKISEDFEKTEIKNIIISLQQDSQKAAAEIKSGLEKIKPKIIEINAKIQVKIKSYQNDPRFEPLLKIIEPFSEALNKLKEQLEKLDENEQFKALKGKIGSTKEEIVKIEENIKAVQLKDIYYKVKDKIQNFDINGKLVKLNEEKVKFLEERQKYKELETAAQKIEFIFNSGKVISKEDIEEIKKNIEKIKEKLTSLGDESLDAIIDQINKICSGITKNIDKDEIKSKIKEALSKLGEFEGQVKNFDEKKEQEKNQEALTRLKDKANGFNATNILKKIDDMVFESVQAANTTLKLVNRILLDYLNSTDNPTFSGMTKNLTETLEAKIKDLIASAQEAINGTKLEGIVNVISESDEMKELMKKIEELEESVKKYEDKSPEEIKKELIEAFKKSEAGKILQKQADKLEEKLKELRDVVKNKVDLSKLKKIKDKIQDKAEENEKISEYIEKIKSLNKVLKTIIESKAFNKTTNNIKDYIKGIDFKDIITILKEVKNVNVSQEIENAKRIKELTEEINSIYESDPLVNIFKKLNNEKRLLSKVENKKGNKKTKKNLRKLQDKTGEITCKIDKKYNSATSISVEKGTSMQSNILKQTTQFSLSFSSEIKFSIEGDKLNCPAPFVNQVKQNVNFAKHEKFKKEPSNGRIRFRMFFRIRRVRTFVIPRFFYLILRIRIVRHSISTLRKLQNEEEKETYCVPEEDNLSESTSEESPFNCFLYDDNVSDIASLGNITSDYAGNLTDSLSIDEDNGEIGTSSNSGNNNGRKYFRESSGRKLSAGAIVGIVIGSVAVVALILGLTLYLKGKTASAAPIQGDLSDTQKNFQINNSVNVPVNQ